MQRQRVERKGLDEEQAEDDDGEACAGAPGTGATRAEAREEGGAARGGSGGRRPAGGGTFSTRYVRRTDLGETELEPRRQRSGDVRASQRYRHLASDGTSSTLEGSPVTIVCQRLTSTR